MMADRVWDDPLDEYDAAELAADEFAEAAEEYDRAGEAWYEQHYQPGVTDPVGGE